MADPRRIELRSPHVEAALHLPVLPGPNVAYVNAMAQVIVTEGLRAAARLYAGAPNASVYYGLGVTEHSQETADGCARESRTRRRRRSPEPARVHLRR